MACMAVTIIRHTGIHHVVTPESSVKDSGISWCSITNPPGVLLGRFGRDLSSASTAESGMTSWRPILRIGSNCLAFWDCMGLLQSVCPHLRRHGRVAGPEAPNYGRKKRQGHRRPDESRPGDTIFCQTDPTTHKCCIRFLVSLIYCAEGTTQQVYGWWSPQVWPQCPQRGDFPLIFSKCTVMVWP